MVKIKYYHENLKYYLKYSWFMSAGKGTKRWRTQ